MRPNYERERGLLREQKVGNVRISGSETFITEVMEALSHLKRAYPYGYSLAQRYIRGVVESDTRRGMGIPIRVIYQSRTREDKRQITSARFAAHLVRQAIAFRKLLGFCLWRSPRSELGSLKRELRAMEILHCEPQYFHRVQNEILLRERQIRSDRDRGIN